MSRMVDLIRSVLLLCIFLVPKVEGQSKPTLNKIDSVFYAAGVPQELWDDFATVAACESSGDASPPVGDGGQAFGLFQIHWDTWAPWARSLGYGKYTNPESPVENAHLAWMIGKNYSIPRHKDRWDQWSVKRWWDECKQRSDIYWRK